MPNTKSSKPYSKKLFHTDSAIGDNTTHTQKQTKGKIMATLAELEKAVDEVRKLKVELSKQIGGDKWVVCVQDHYTPVQFTVWMVEHNKIAGSNYATLSTDAIIDSGYYTQEELQPLLDKIKGIASE